MYTEQVMDHFMNPRNVGEIEDASGVTETAYACGFNSTSYFIRVFTRSTGMTPAKYRAAAAQRTTKGGYASENQQKKS